MATKNDKIILDLKKQIELKKKALATANKFTPITNCSLELGSMRYNLHVANKDTLLFLLATLGSLQLGLNHLAPSEVLKLGSFEIGDWITDIQNKFTNLNLSLEKDRLKKLEDKLHNLLSVDKKVELEIDELKGLI